MSEMASNYIPKDRQAPRRDSQVLGTPVYCDNSLNINYQQMYQAQAPEQLVQNVIALPQLGVAALALQQGIHQSPIYYSQPYSIQQSPMSQVALNCNAPNFYPRNSDETPMNQTGAIAKCKNEEVSSSAGDMAMSLDKSASTTEFKEDDITGSCPRYIDKKFNSKDNNNPSSYVNSHQKEYVQNTPKERWNGRGRGYNGRGNSRGRPGRYNNSPNFNQENYYQDYRSRENYKPDWRYKQNYSYNSDQQRPRKPIPDNQHKLNNGLLNRNMSSNYQNGINERFVRPEMRTENQNYAYYNNNKGNSNKPFRSPYRNEFYYEDKFSPSNEKRMNQKDCPDSIETRIYTRNGALQEKSNGSSMTRTCNKSDSNKELTAKKSQSSANGLNIDKTQKESMSELLTKGTYECMVCCDRIKQAHAIWSCNNCYNCFHMGCIKKWAGTSQGEKKESGSSTGWRCPACQCANEKIPNQYLCFCKKMREPDWNRRDIPHSCGEMCGKKRGPAWCSHKCNVLCHPGPCPPCTAYIRRECPCGKNSQNVRCSQIEPFLCDEECSKSLNCKKHFCLRKCHTEECANCLEDVTIVCFCGKQSEVLPCMIESLEKKSFSCKSLCNKMLDCGLHDCEDVCHENNCRPCQRTIDIVRTCPCTKTLLCTLYSRDGIPKRLSCTDDIPTCGSVCEKKLKCGVPGSFHECRAKCHEDKCPPCDKVTKVRCRCGAMDIELPCRELTSKADEVLCAKQCKKVRQCGKHKCGQKCCIDIDHICNRVCGKVLKCKLHKCEEPCHRGNCPRCWQTSFDELSCFCGTEILYPPIPCGTSLPQCKMPCGREHACSHQVTHNCHAENECPPCTSLTPKSCLGKHTIMKSTPCYVEAISCGDLCGRDLPCKVHKCQKVCHAGKCVTKGCTQKCNKKRESCEHPCAAKCHPGKCPDVPCKAKVTVSCICGNRKLEMVCSDNEREYRAMATSRLATMMHSNLQSGHTVDLTQILSGSNKPENVQRLECNDHCDQLARNKRLALALQISNPESREKLGDHSNLYSEMLKEMTRKDVNFATMVDSALNELVMKARESKQKSRSHSFVPMNNDKRHFIHEYSKHFGCDSMSYDEEPKKNVVVTAYKGKCYLPPASVIAVIKKEQGQRKGPGPVLTRKNCASDDSSVQMKKLEKASSFEKKDNGTSNAATQPIDYFDFN